MIRTILVPLTAEVSGATLFLDAALVLARRVNSHIRALFILPDPDAAVAYLPVVILATGVTREISERETREAAAGEKGRFIGWRTRNNLPETAGGRLDTCFATWAEQTGEIEAVVTRRGRLSDLIVVPRPVTGSVHAQRCFDAAVFGTGRPTLVVSETLPSDMTDHVMIAWNGSTEASHAVLGAMPILHLASRVSIFAAPQYDIEGVNSVDLAESLSWHGIHAHPVVGPKDNHATGPALVAAAVEQQATLIVMGAYTHSRLRQSFSRRCDKAPASARSNPSADEPLRRPGSGSGRDRDRPVGAEWRRGPNARVLICCGRCRVVLPAEALSLLSMRQLAPDLLLHPILDEAEALTGVRLCSGRTERSASQRSSRGPQIGTAKMRCLSHRRVQPGNPASRPTKRQASTMCWQVGCDSQIVRSVSR